MSTSSYKILYCSSESTDHPASSLLSDGIWLTDGYVREAVLEIGFDSPTKISKIELGNAGCAFVEGLVTNQENPQDSNDYQLILPIVNLMSYSESKNATPQARTRRFVWSAADKLKPEVCAQSWRRLRLVCKQIFNTQHPIGLSLLHINPTQLTTTPPPIIPTTTIQATVEKKTITKTNVDDRTETNTTQTSGKETKLESPQSTTTEKSESGSVENVTKSNKKKIVVPLLDEEENISQDSSTSQSELFRALKPPTTFAELKAKIEAEEKEEIKKELNTKPSTQMNTTENTQSQNKQTNEKNKTTPVSANPKSTLHKKTEKSSETSPQSQTTQNTKKMKSSSTTTTSHTVPYSQILKGVVAVISGIPLPERATLRDKVIAMGGTYSPTWHSGCTHLIAAFTGTPKYTQALESGAYIVTKQWVYECSQQKTRLAETHFKLSAPSFTQSQSAKTTASKTNASTKKSTKKKTDPEEEESEEPNEYDFSDGFLVKDDEEIENETSQKSKQSKTQPSKLKTTKSVLSLEEDDLDTIREAKEWLQSEQSSGTKRKRESEDIEHPQSQSKSQKNEKEAKNITSQKNDQSEPSHKKQKLQIQEKKNEANNDNSDDTEPLDE